MQIAELTSALLFEQNPTQLHHKLLTPAVEISADV